MPHQPSCCEHAPGTGGQSIKKIILCQNDSMNLHFNIQKDKIKFLLQL